jgi:hypothetical protein
LQDDWDDIWEGRNERVDWKIAEILPGTKSALEASNEVYPSPGGGLGITDCIANVHACLRTQILLM